MGAGADDSGSMFPLVSFVIPVRNDAEGLSRCLASVWRNDYPSDRMEVVVADNGSTDGSDVVARGSGAIVVSFSSIHVGELRNRASRVARGSVLAFVDADHEICDDWTRSAVETLRGLRVAAVGAPCRAPERGTWVQRTYDLLRRRSGGCRDAEWLGSGNMAVWRAAFERAGGFAPELETCEDVDVCRRLRDHGYRIVSDDRLRSTHFGDPLTLGAVFWSELWRGRDNVRASVRGNLTLRDVPGVAIPIIDLAMLMAGVAGLALAPTPGVKLTLWAFGTIGALSAMRAAVMLARCRAVGALKVAQILLVALVYDLARALALVARVPHRRARRKIASSLV